MKRILIFAGLLAVLSTMVFAQNSSDKQLADWLRQVTDRSTDGLTEVQHADGSVSVDLKGRFQNVMMARTNSIGDVHVGCINTLDQANRFIGRDLETGDTYPQLEFPAESLGDQARRHGMSEKEFSFYKRMIERFSSRANLGGATINVINNDGANEGFNDPAAATPEGGNMGTTLGQQRLNVFNFAAGIWGALLDSAVDIQVNAQFDPQTCTPTQAVLGSASTTTVHRDHANASFPMTWHHQALANKQAGSDLSANPDINTTFNSNLNGQAGCLGGRRWYLGFDNSTPANTTNLLIVVLHELGHGLGFSEFTNGNTGGLFNGLPDVFTSFMFDMTTMEAWNDMTDMERFTSGRNPDNVVFVGDSIQIASPEQNLTNGWDPSSGSVELFTPALFNGGSSLSHFNTDVTPSVLMEPSITLNLPLDLDLTRQQMRDIGWFRDEDEDGTADTITNVTPSAPTVPPNSQATVTWTNNGTFSRNVTIDISFDGGANFGNVIATDIANNGSHTFTVPSTTTSQAVIRVREHNFAAPVGTSGLFTIGNAAAPNGTKFDFDGDNKTDPSIFRPGPGQWWYLRSSDGTDRAFTFGLSSDIEVPADFTGDGIADIAFWRPTSGEWFILRSDMTGFFSFPFGATGDIPAPGDFDGDGTDDAGIFRPSTGTFFLQQSGGGGTRIEAFGTNGDVPLIGDYDGDNTDDVAIYRPSVSQFWQLRSTQGLLAFSFGSPGVAGFTADFSGDGTSDMGVYQNGNWSILRSEDNGFFGFPFGTTGDIPVPGDYDGDGQSDPAVFRPSTNTWFSLSSTAGQQFFQFGTAGDRPVPNVYVAD